MAPRRLRGAEYADLECILLAVKATERWLLSNRVDLPFLVFIGSKQEVLVQVLSASQTSGFLSQDQISAFQDCL